MIEAARSEYIHYSSDPKFSDRVDFKLDTIENYVFTNKSQKYDVVYSNATLHWIPSSYHSVLFPQIISNVMKKNNSILAIQMPDTKNQQSHLLMETGQYSLSFSRT
jgi:trans-aconitate methyltransferase